MNTHLPFHEAVERHGATVLRVCATTLGPGTDAEDAWSDTFVTALAAWPLDEVRNLEAWLVTVARRRCIDVLRASRRVVPRDHQDAHFSDGEVAADAWLASGARFDVNPANAASGDPALTWDDELWGHVAQLTPRQQFVVAHRFIAQWTYPEIAEKLGCSPAAARRCGADAIAALRLALDITPGDRHA